MCLISHPPDIFPVEIELEDVLERAPALQLGLHVKAFDELLLGDIRLSVYDRAAFGDVADI